jgi:hypothetical protein
MTLIEIPDDQAAALKARAAAQGLTPEIIFGSRVQRGLHKFFIPS